MRTRSLVTPPPRRVPVFRPLNRVPAVRPRFQPQEPGQVQLKVAIACLAATIAGAVAVVSLMDGPGDHGATAGAQQGIADPVTLPPILSPTGGIPVVLSSASPTTAPTVASVPLGREVPGSGRRVPSTTPATTAATTWPTTALALELKPGAAIGLEESGRPGFRVRHRDFLGRVDLIGPQSSALDHADSRFTVRAGGAPGCVSLESTNYPGYFLRNRDSVIRLDRADNSPWFRQDSTFCPVHIAQGAIILRSANDPASYVTERDSSLYLTRVPASAATGFLVKAPF